jgi:hypothetical protein
MSLMQIVLYFFLTLIALWMLARAIKHKSLYPFISLQHNFGKRRDTFRKTLAMLDERGVKTMVETGSARLGFKGAKSNGASTVVFAKWAQGNGALLHTVDISEQSINAARTEVDNQGLGEFVEWHLQDSLKFLADFDQPVDFLYLDSYDYSKTDTSIQLKSQLHHLAEFKAIESRLHDQTFVLIDDCGLPNGGKGKLAIEYMKKRGWRVLVEDYQVILIRAT